MIELAFNFAHFFKVSDLKKKIEDLLDKDGLSGSVITTPDLFYIVKDILKDQSSVTIDVECFPLVENGETAEYFEFNDAAFAVISEANLETGVRIPTAPLEIPIPKIVIRAADVLPETAALTARLRDELLEKFPFSRSNTPAESPLFLPNTFSISFRNINGEAIAAQLFERGMNVMTGSACASPNKKPSKTLQAMNVPYDLAMGSIHFSLGPEINEKDIDLLIEHLTDIIGQMLKYSF